MACRPDLLNLDEQRITIAIKSNVFDRLGMPAGFAFHPELLARPAPKMCSAGGYRFFQRSPVHPRHHQHPAIIMILNNRRNQAIAIEFQFFVKVHNCRKSARLHCKPCYARSLTAINVSSTMSKKQTTLDAPPLRPRAFGKDALHPRP